MALIAWPQEAGIVGVSHELWAPGRIVHRLRDGSIAAALDRASPRWRGTVSIAPRAVWYPEGSVAVGRVETLLAELADPSNWTHMPWGGAGAGQYPTPRHDWVGSVTGTNAGAISIDRTEGATGLAVGQWLDVHLAGGIRTALVRTLAGTDQKPVVTLLPSFSVPNATRIDPGEVIRVRKAEPGEEGITIERSRSWGGRVTFQWEEAL